MKYTSIYGLKKPEAEDYYNVEDFNENIDIIETELQDRLPLSKSGCINGRIYFKDGDSDIGWIGPYNGNMKVYSEDTTLIENCSSEAYYYTSRNGYEFVDIAKVFKPVAVTVAAYLSDDKFKAGADYVSTTETGDKSAIIKAVNACPEGGTVILLPGEYVITREVYEDEDTNSIEIKKSITITGASSSSVVLRQEGEIATPTIIFKVMAENTAIENMTLRMQTDSNSEITFLISVMSSHTSIKGCIFESETGISYVSNAIQFYYDESATKVNPDDESGYILEGVIIEDCRFNVDYPSLVPDEGSITASQGEYCDLIRTGNVKVSGRIYGNISAKGFITFYNSFADISYNNDLVIFGNGAVRDGGYYGEEVRSYGF
ncbi:MAG: hypothetical protein LIO44_05715 [Eubacterium sp.]|nr:hypothetical protein [Eubacterium sp.]